MKDRTIKIISWDIFALFMFYLAIFAIPKSHVISISLVSYVVIHEFGHVFAKMAFKIPVKTIYFIPFFRAGVISKESRNLKSYGRLIIIVLSGLVAGMLFCIPVYAYYLYSGKFSALFVLFLIAAWTFLNLIPRPIFDGGRMFEGMVVTSDADIYTVSLIWVITMAIIFVIFWLKGLPLVGLYMLIPSLFGKKSITNAMAKYEEIESDDEETEVKELIPVEEDSVELLGSWSARLTAVVYISFIALCLLIMQWCMNETYEIRF